MGDPEPTPVSFTDTNAETGATGKDSAGTSSNMMELVGQLKKKKTESDTANTKSSKGGKKGKKDKKKKKKKDKTKTKYVRRHDRFEPENYLLRIEGTICCAFLIAVLLFLLYNALIIIIILIITAGDIHHLHNTEDHAPSATTSSKPEKASG